MKLWLYVGQIWVYNTNLTILFNDISCFCYCYFSNWELSVYKYNNASISLIRQMLWIFVSRVRSFVWILSVFGIRLRLTSFPIPDVVISSPVSSPREYRCPQLPKAVKHMMILLTELLGCVLSVIFFWFNFCGKKSILHTLKWSTC